MSESPGVEEVSRVNPFPTTEYEFGLCLTHDVDRPYKGFQSLYYAALNRDPEQLSGLLPGHNPWWQFEQIMKLEAGMGVRSAFYFLNEQHLLRDRQPKEWLQPYYWIEHIGRYDPTGDEIQDIIDTLEERGWEIGLHGSIGTHQNRDQLAAEKAQIEEILEGDVIGGRQHHLKLDVPGTWERHADVGLAYDTSLGSATDNGFDHGYDLLRPFDDEFVVFPLTIMDKSLASGTTETSDACSRCHELLETAQEHNAVMTVLWHPRNFFETDFPGQEDIYRDLIETALEMDAWVGPPGHLYKEFELGKPARSSGSRESPDAENSVVGQ